MPAVQQNTWQKAYNICRSNIMFDEYQKNASDDEYRRYYERLSLDVRFRENSDKKLIRNEIARRIQKIRMQKEKQVDERRRRLVELLQTDERREEELCRQKVESELEAKRKALFIEAETMKRKLTKKREQVANEKRSQIAVDLPEVREEMYRHHIKEIQKDREEIKKMNELDRIERLREEAIVNSQRSKLDELFDQRELDAQAQRKLRIKYSEMQKKEVEERKFHMAEIKRSKLLQEANEIEEDRKTYTEENAKIMKIKKTALLEAARNDILEARKRKEEAKHKELLAEKFTTPLITGPSNEGRREEKEALRKQQLRFLDYKKRLSLEEACLDKELDKQCQTMADRKRFETLERNKNRLEQLKKLREEISKSQRQSVQEKYEERKNEIQALKEARAITLKQEIKMNEQLWAEEQTRRDNAKAYGDTLDKQRMEVQALREQVSKEEMELEKRMMVESEARYQRRLKEALYANPLLSVMHPWRKPSMRNGN